MKAGFTSLLSLSLSTGKGALVLYEEVGEIQGQFKEVGHWPWKDGLFDVTWSEVNEAILVAGSGDGNLLVIDQSIQGQPAAVLTGHTSEVCKQQLKKCGHQLRCLVCTVEHDGLATWSNSLKKIMSWMD